MKAMMEFLSQVETYNPTAQLMAKPIIKLYVKPR